MASLYSIDQEILSCIDIETGEVIDVEALNSLMMQREQKIESVALWIKNLQADAIAFKAEKDAFSEREKSAKNKIESLKKWLLFALEGQKFSTTKCAVSFRRSEQVEILDLEAVPKELVTETVEIKPDKMAIKALLKDGQTVNGCQLVENYNTQIK